MNFKIWSGLATVSLLLATVGIAPSSRANPVTPSAEPAAQTPAATQSPSNSPIASTVIANAVIANTVIGPEPEETKVGQVASTPSDAPTPGQVPSPSQVASDASTPTAPAVAESTTAEAVKVGEYQSQEQPEESIAVMQSYESDGRQVATLYVRNIPVLSFLGSEGSARAAEPVAGTKVSSSNGSSAVSEVTVSQVASQPQQAANPNDPVVRATAIAAQINQLHRNNADASSIRAVWDESKKRYLIKVGEDTLTAIDPATILADTTNDAEQDALQATNRLRRLLGNAQPLTEVEGAPRAATLVSVGPVQFSVSGYASWYGPGFHGNQTASGEVFNQNALTAAHPNLPFGTQVRVTNMDNGLSVVVRITDRGPYVGDRVIDLAAGAADVIGLTNAGVAPVKLDILGAAGN
jgi:rare lipoprotein A